MKKQLRLLAWILSLTMLCELLPFSAFAQSDVGEALASTVSTLLDETNDIVDSGTCGDNVTWSFSSDGTLTLSGTGRTDHYPTNPNTNLAFGNIADEIQIIIINDGITTIGTDLFSYLDNLLEVRIPDSVTVIGDGAFMGCSNLTNISIPNSVTSISDNTFYDCNSLTSISIPNSVTSIGQFAFYGCNSLTSISIPNNVTSIDCWTFTGCSSLTNISIPNSVTFIGDGAFWGCSNLTNISIPNSVTKIGTHAFYDCSSLIDISIPNSVTSIGSTAFMGCSSLTNISISNSVTKIDTSVFSDCSSLTSISIPSSVTSIEGAAFLRCISLSDVYYSGTEEQWKAISISNSNNWNDCLLNATIHYTSTGDSSDPEPVKPEPTNPEPVNPDPEPAKKEFDSSKDGFSFAHISTSFFQTEEIPPERLSKNASATDKLYFLAKYPAYRYQISNNRLKQLVKGLKPFDRQVVLNAASSPWEGSCHGLSTIAMLHYITPEYIPLSELPSSAFKDSSSQTIYNLCEPKNSDDIEDLINWYQLSQNLPSFIKFQKERTAYCKSHPQEAIENIITSIKNDQPVLVSLGTHAVILLSIKSEEDDCYKINVYDPNADNLTLSILKSSSTQIDINFNDGHTYNQIFYYITTDTEDFKILDLRNYFGLSDNEQNCSTSFISFAGNAFLDICSGIRKAYYKSQVLSDEFNNFLLGFFANDSVDSESEPQAILFLPEYDSNSSIQINYTPENSDSITLHLNETLLYVSSDTPISLTYTEENRIVDITTDASSAVSILLTQNDTTENWPWHSWAIDTTGTTTLHAELTDEGLKLSGDGLNNAAFATENADTEDTQTSTISAKADSDTGIASVTIKNNQDSEGNNTLEVTQPSNATKPTAHTISITNGTASVTAAASGEIVTITAADKSAEKKVFTSWTVNSGNVTLDDSSASTTSFVMGSENVSITANYKTVNTTLSEPTKPTEPDNPETPSSDDDGSGALILLGVGAAAVAAATAGVVYMMPVKIQGKVESSDHIAIPNAKVSILKNGNVVAQTTADENGNFEFKVKRGTYELTAAYTDASGQLIHQTIQQKAPAENVVITF